MRAGIAVLVFWFAMLPMAFASTLVGTWTGIADGEPLTVTFAADGGGTANGAPMRWQVMGNLLFIEQEGQVSGYQFQIEADRLTVAGGDFASVVVLARGAAAPKQAAPKPAVPRQAAPGGGATSGELVGKWCKGGAFSAVSGGGSSSMACFELKADGSYSYEYEGSVSAYSSGMYGGSASQSSDRGQWSVSGGVLTARSAGGTVAQYRLEKRNHPKNRDPMICLDGDCYVTYWQKAPW